MENTGAPNGVEDVENANSAVFVYQNQNSIHVQSKDMTRSFESVIVYNLVGREILVNNNVNKALLNIDGSSLQSGAYFVKVEYASGEMETQKIVFVKQ